MLHNVDFHAVCGPGGGAQVLTAETGKTASGDFRLMHPGLFVYHCAVEPVGEHMANGMYGLILVEPEEGLNRVNKEFYIMQSEFYAKVGSDSKSRLLEFNYDNALNEVPSHVVFNGKDGALRGDGFF